MQYEDIRNETIEIVIDLIDVVKTNPNDYTHRNETKYIVSELERTIDSLNELIVKINKEEGE